ncbi:MAG: sulfatase [Thermoanaerobaculia bacterium]|nr:sulfatase [Thermoanaerobaculia bacterium]
MPLRTQTLSLLLLLLAAPFLAIAEPVGERPNILLLCIDTLRADRLSIYGYERPTSPVIDALLGQGVRFLDARTVEPLTGPASASLITSRFPHEHGATRNGLRMRPGMPSLPKLLAARGYATAAFVGNWSLKDRLTGLGEHFDLYQEVFSRKRWFGLFNSEATGEDLTAEVVDWIGEHRRARPGRPYFVWVQYVEPHAPYRLWEDLGARLGIDTATAVSKSDRYDTEVAFVDRQLGDLLDRLFGGIRVPDDTILVFASDHGESLGDHDYWGHGEFVYDNSLRIPMGLVWNGRVESGVAIAQPALIIDLVPTLLGLLGLPSSERFLGYDWSTVLVGGAEAPQRATYYQAHRGTVQMDHTSVEARVGGLLELGRVVGNRKEVLDLRHGTVRIYDLSRDPDELTDLSSPGETPSAELLAWRREVEKGLQASSDLPPPDLDAESLARLRALGYLD